LTQKELDDVIAKLHLTNKVRHETEIRLGEAHEKMKEGKEVIKGKEDDLEKK
jgi:hypothetical protein